MQPSEIHSERRAIYDTGVITVLHVRNLCREFANGSISVLDAQRMGRRKTSTSHVYDIGAAVLENPLVWVRRPQF